jgi:excisionase family DNA binding protein
MRDPNVTKSKPAVVTIPAGNAIPRRLVRLKDAAQYLSLSPWKVRKLIQDRRLPVVHDGDGSPFLLDLCDLDAYVTSNKRLTPL